MPVGGKEGYFVGQPYEGAGVPVPSAQVRVEQGTGNQQAESRNVSGVQTDGTQTLETARTASAQAVKPTANKSIGEGAYFVSKSGI